MVIPELISAADLLRDFVVLASPYMFHAIWFGLLIWTGAVRGPAVVMKFSTHGAAGVFRTTGGMGGGGPSGGGSTGGGSGGGGDGGDGGSGDDGPNKNGPGL